MNLDEITSARNALLEVAERLQQQLAGKFPIILSYEY